MAQYRFGVVFNFERMMRQNDPTGVFIETDIFELLEEIVDFLTDDVTSVQEAKERVNEIEYFINLLYSHGIVKEHTFFNDISYVKICGILFSICESIVDVFNDVALYDLIRESEFRKPNVHRVSRTSFAILIKHPLGHHENTRVRYTPKEELSVLRERIKGRF